MSGREGAAEARGRMGSLQALCRGLLAAWRSRDAGHESSWLWDGRRRVVGIAEASGGRALLFAELLAEGESYQLASTRWSCRLTWKETSGARRRTGSLTRA